MKLNWIKVLLSFAVAIILGLLCFTFATENGCRNWISFAVSAFSITAMLIPTIAVEYNNIRSLNIKTVGWIFTLVTIVLNFVFAFIVYTPTIYISITLLAVVVGIAIIYAIRPKNN